MAEKTKISIGPTMCFYPHYCLDCHFGYLGKQERTNCPRCKGNNCINHKREILKEHEAKAEVTSAYEEMKDEIEQELQG